MLVLSWYYVLGISVLALLIFDSELRADVDSFKLYFIVDFIPSQNAYFFASSVELSKSWGRYLIDLNVWLDVLVVASLGFACYRGSNSNDKRI